VRNIPNEMRAIIEDEIESRNYNKEA
jgi:hypothetical protein